MNLKVFFEEDYKNFWEEVAKAVLNSEEIIENNYEKILSSDINSVQVLIKDIDFSELFGTFIYMDEIIVSTIGYDDLELRRCLGHYSIECIGENASKVVIASCHLIWNFWFSAMNEIKFKSNVPSLNNINKKLSKFNISEKEFLEKVA